MDYQILYDKMLSQYVLRHLFFNIFIHKKKEYNKNNLYLCVGIK